VVDVFLQQRTARVERPLTYAVAGDATLGVGDVVRVPLGPRELYGYVISGPRDALVTPATRAVLERVPGPRAFDDAGLALARFIAERSCASLGEALGAVVFAAAVPRVVDTFVVAAPLDPPKFPKVPPRLLRLIAEDFRDGFALEALLRHPEARRAGDRRTLLAAIGNLTRAGALERRRTFVAARTTEARENFLTASGREVRGPRVRALVRLAAESGGMRRRDAVLAGFSQAIVARAIREGGLVESAQRAPRARTAGRREEQDFAPTAEQTAAIEAVSGRVEAQRFAEILLQGVTGSGKTFVYIRAIARLVAAGGRAIVLVPEISLTPQTARRFETVFGERVAVLHSGLSDRERYDGWQAAARGEVDVVVGARSALFAPLPNVRLVVIDEAHERSYKQDTVPRYDAIEVAREKMRLAGGVLVLGSATPPLGAYARARSGEIAYVRLDARATELPLPEVTVIDLAREFERGNRRIFSTALVAALGLRLERGEKSVLFINRRGSASFMLCRSCGAVPDCLRCSLSLRVHRGEGLLRCHLCDAQRPVPDVCPACGERAIRDFGVGTERVAQEAQKLFPSARIVRMDSDTTTRVGDHARLLDEFGERADILVGTQMVAKGLDFPTVTLAAVVAADVGLHAADFRAAERTFGLIEQVAGRSGRTRRGEAIVQTYAPAHPAITFAARHDYDGFAAQELASRRELGYPPFAELIYVGAIGRNRTAVVAAAARNAELLRTLPDVEVLGPAPYAVARANDEWRYRVALKARDATRARRFIRETLVPLAAADRSVRLSIDVDS
jgi:primosomal protein N' (replication factor Y)